MSGCLAKVWSSNRAPQVAVSATVGTLWWGRKRGQEKMDATNTGQSPLCGWWIVQMTTGRFRDNAKPNCIANSCHVFSTVSLLGFLNRICQCFHHPEAGGGARETCFLEERHLNKCKHSGKFPEGAELAVSLPSFQCTATCKQPKGKMQGRRSTRDPSPRVTHWSHPCEGGVGNYWAPR